MVDRATVDVDAPAAAAAGAPLRSGVLLGSCRVDGVLAAGDSGFVYHATDLLLRREVVLKEFFLPTISERDTDGVRVVAPPERGARHAATLLQAHDAFVAEARRLGRLRHPGLLPVWQLVESHGTLMRVMPRLNGPTLAVARASSARPVDAGRWRAQVLQLLDALEALHGSGGAHGHLHPWQVVHEGVAGPVLLGFGAATRVLSSRVDAAHEPYVAPERFSAAGPPLAAADLYALAALAWFMATGMPPPSAAERAQGLPFDLRGGLREVFGPALDGPDIGALAEQIERALALEPLLRPSSAAAWRAACAPGAGLHDAAAAPAGRAPAWP